MEQVTIENLDERLARFATLRGGEHNQETESEAMFVCCGKYSGLHVLHTGYAIVWVGVQNCSARVSNNGAQFPSVGAALKFMLELKHPLFRGSQLYLSTDSRQLLRWMADKIDEHYAADDFLCWAVVRGE